MEPTTTLPTTDSSSNVYQVEFLAPAGLGYGAGPTSYADRTHDLDDTKLRDTIKSGTAIKPIDGNAFEDTCSEGQVLNSDQKAVPQVFGGGAAVAIAAMIGLKTVPDQNLNDIAHQAIDNLKNLHLSYGIHIDSHAPEGLCGCQVIDMLPQILSNIVGFRPQILGTLSALHMNMGSVDELMLAFSDYTEKHVDPKAYNARQIAEAAYAAGAIVKDQSLHPKELYVVLNNVAGTTLDQASIDTLSDGSARVYGVDVWRLQMLSQQLFASDAIAAHKALQSSLIFTFGVLATLTKGDLPVFSVSN